MSNKNPKGFGGLSQLHSKSEAQADPVESNFQSETPTDTITASTSEAESSSKHELIVSSGSEPEVTVETVQTERQKFNQSGVSWGYIFWFLLIAGIFMVISQDNDNSSSAPKSATSSLANSIAKTPTASQLGSPSGVGKTNKPRNETPELQYNKPPIGSNNVLSVSQIRWCTRESMRIEAMRNVFDTNGGIGEFNKIVDDYNSRCSNYRYRQGDLSRAEREVEKSRAIIVSEATREAELIDQRFKKTSNVSTKSASNKPDAQLTREVQQLLTVLGYKPGPIDGDYGPGTSSAIKAFQRDSSLAQTGGVDRELLSSLRSKERSRSLLNVGVKTNNRPSNNNEVPANAQIDYTGRKWVCNSGYRQDGNRCLKIAVPANAKIDYTGRKWVCNSGYRQDGNRCLKITVPANARIDYTGRKWVCNSGYRPEGEQCVDY
ncbi:peptidoglycan-binding protein [Vibrio brasiliensis]|uniref:peptidoglycan-binding protein n=1 Tax=Vibrio brasiliensis TaxID=170652 RepID=UPI001EFD530D|nr:peptidoglycan-binding protein [Vibrio brasiliensis]MCG9724971.1 peptidoglycan-binding protein [Vibrio brasiliensis]